MLQATRSDLCESAVLQKSCKAKHRWPLRKGKAKEGETVWRRWNKKKKTGKLYKGVKGNRESFIRQALCSRGRNRQAFASNSPTPLHAIASYLMVPVVCTLGHYGLGIDFNRGCHWINGSLLPPEGALAMKLCPLGGVVSPAFIIQPANTP